ncbi:MAG: hypothetical protein PHU25_21560, partial [Deltaproteobacteria bacterium]|nr:hypothetical protein [Deltaproteobacteria bacterium]
SEDYTGAKKVKVALESLKAGDRCPECERGKLYVHPPSVLVRVTGIAPQPTTDRVRVDFCEARHACRKLTVILDHFKGRHTIGV